MFLAEAVVVTVTRLAAPVQFTFEIVGQAAEDADQGGLATAVGAFNLQDFPFAQRERQFPDQDPVIPFAVELSDVQ